VRAVVEISRALGGMRMRALLRAIFTPDPEIAVTVFEVPYSERMGFGAVAGCLSELGRPLVAGLPLDFAGAVLEGVAGSADAALPSGRLRIDRAAFDDVDSSQVAFRFTGDLLSQVIGALIRGEDPAEVSRAAMVAW
jgi:hypothetical protein